MFLPSGTMCNQIAILTHCRPGDEILAHETAHILTSEGSGGAALAGAQITPLRGPRGQFDADAVRAALRPRDSRYAPPQALLEVEQTANTGGGTVWPLQRLHDVAEVAHAAGLATHMDGARLMNAAVAAGVPAADMAAGYDSVWLDFTKGLGAPLGAVLCGSRRVHRPGLALEAAPGRRDAPGRHLRRRLPVCARPPYRPAGRGPRERPRCWPAAWREIPGITVEPPETNLVFFDTSGTGLTAADLFARVRPHGVTFSVNSTWRGRACTHLDVSRGADRRGAGGDRGGGLRVGRRRIQDCGNCGAAKISRHRRPAEFPQSSKTNGFQGPVGPWRVQGGALALLLPQCEIA